MRYFPIEAAYYGFGKAYAQGTVPAGTGTASLAVIGILMLGHCAIDGGVGASYGETEATFSATANEVSCSTCASTSGPSGARGVLSR